MNNKITEQDFKQYTKEEIVKALIKHQELFKTSAVLGELERNKEYELWCKYEKYSRIYCKLLSEYSDFLKELKAKYGDTPILEFESTDLQKIRDLQTKLEKAEIEEAKADYEYEQQVGMRYR